MKFRSAVLLLLVGFAGGVLAFLVAQWLRPAVDQPPAETVRRTLLDEARGARLRLAARHPQLALDAARGARRRPARLDVRLSERDLRDLTLLALERSDDGRPWLEAARLIEARIADGELGIYAVVELSRIDRERLGPRQREVVDRLIRMVPILADHGLPIGVYGRPLARAGGVRIDSPRVEVSVIKLSVETLRERLGVAPERLTEALELELPGYEVREVRVDEGHLALRLRRGANAAPAS